MAQFQVPQFIEIEQKVIGGRLTMRQFLYIVGGAGVLIVPFYLLSFFTWIIFAVIVGAAVLALAFLKINGRPLNSLIRAAFLYYWNPSFYLWRSPSELEIEIPEIKTPIHKYHDVTPEKGTVEFKRLEPKKLSEALLAKEKEIGKQVQDLWEKVSAYSWQEKDNTRKETGEVKRPAIPETFVVQPELKPKAQTPVIKIERGEIQQTTKPSKVKLEAPREKIIQLSRKATPPTKASRPGHEEERERLKIGKQVQDLWEKISTSRDSVPRREKAINIFQRQRLEENYRLMRKSTGEIEKARRVDFK